MSSAGLLCVAWSYAQRTKHRRDEHPSEALVAAWVQERLALAEQEWEDVWFLEQVPQFPQQVPWFAEKVKTPLEGKFGMASVVSGPQFFGEPSFRTRLHAAGWNNATMVWVGPHQDMIEEDFILRFHRACVLDGTAYLRASEAEMDEEHKRLR